MSGVSLETRWALKERWNNKFCYKVASCLFLLNNVTSLSWTAVVLDWSSCKCFKFRPPGSFWVTRGQFTLRWESFVAFEISCTDTKKYVQYIIHICGYLLPFLLSTKIDDWIYMTDHDIYLVQLCRLRTVKCERLVVWNLKATGSIPNVSDNFCVAKQNKESERLPWSCPAMDPSTRCCVVCSEQRADRWRQHGTPVGRHTPPHCTAEYSSQ